MSVPKQNDTSGGLSRTMVSFVNTENALQTFHRRPVRHTITVEKIDRALADVQAQIENLRRHRRNMGLVRIKLADMEAKWG